MRKDSLLTALFVLVLTSLLINQLKKNAFCGDAEYKVINVNNVVRLDNKKEKEYRDFYINYGSSGGAVIGQTLNVYRRSKKRSNVSGIADREVTTPIGIMKIIWVDQESATARLIKLDDRAKTPIVEYEGVMIGDIVSISKESIKDSETFVLLENVLFDFDKYNLKPQAQTVLNNIIEHTKKNDYSRITVDGHTDWIGSDEYNIGLSKRRATSVNNYLKQQLGFAENKFKLNFYGETKPVATNKTAQGRQLNRRVEITLERD